MSGKLHFFNLLTLRLSLFPLLLDYLLHTRASTLGALLLHLVTVRLPLLCRTQLQVKLDGLKVLLAVGELLSLDLLLTLLLL